MFVDWFLKVERCGKNSLKKEHKINTLTQGSALLHPGLERWRPLQGLKHLSHPVKGGIFPAQGAAKRNPGSRQTKTLSSVRATLQLSDALLFDVSGYAAWGLQRLFSNP